MRDDFGQGLYLAQKGRKASVAKALKGSGNAGVLEPRIDETGESCRAIYTLQCVGPFTCCCLSQKGEARDRPAPAREGPDAATAETGQTGA